MYVKYSHSGKFPRKSYKMKNRMILTNHSVNIANERTIIEPFCRGNVQDL